MIRRAPRDEKFTVLQNETLEDDDLSWGAVGLLSFLLSKPDHWTVSVEHLINCRDAGRHKIRRILSELEEAGYLVRERKQDEEGKFQWESVIYDTKQTDKESIPGKSVDGSSTDGSSVDGKPPDITKTDSNKDGGNKEGERATPAREDDVDEMFTAILNVMREVGPVSSRDETRAQRLAEDLNGTYAPTIVKNALREDLDGSLQGWNGEVFKDSVLPEYVESSTHTTETAQEGRSAQQVHSKPDDIRSEIR